MAVLQMQRISICALKKNRKAILEKLQAMGVMEINHILEDDEDFHRMDTANARISFDKAASSADKALDILQEYAPKKQSMFSALEGKDLVEQEVYEQIIRDKERLLKTASKIQALDREQAEEKAEILKLENAIEGLNPWLNLDAPMNYGGTAHTVMLPGTMPGGTTMEQVYDLVAEQAPEVDGVEVHEISVEQDSTYLAVFCLRKDAEKVEEALRSGGFAKPAQICGDVPAQAVEAMKEEISAHYAKIEQIRSDVAGLASERENLQLLADYYRVRSEKYAVLGELPQSDRTFVISGYVPKKCVADVERALKDKYDCVIDVEELKEDEEAPVLLKNNAFASGAESVLTAFGLPGKGEIDPTSIMAVFYVFLFGMMLSDAAYGAIVSIACGVLLLKFPRMSESMKKAFQLFFWCGLSTLFWGILFGGYFGDAINVISRVFFGHEVGLNHCGLHRLTIR